MPPQLLGAFLLAVIAAPSVSLSATLAEQCARDAIEGEPAACLQAIEENPNDLESRRYIVGAYTARGDNLKMLEAYRGIIAQTPDDALAHFEYGAALGSLRLYQEAVDALNEAICLNPEFIDAHLVLSIAFQKLGKFEDALTVVERAAVLGGITAMFELAEAYAYGVGTPRDEPAALEWLERAAEFGHIGAMDRLIDIYVNGELGVDPDPDKAERWYFRARAARRDCC